MGDEGLTKRGLCLANPSSPSPSPHSVLPSHCHLGFSWLAPQRMLLESTPWTQFMGGGTERWQEMNWLRTQLPEGVKPLAPECLEAVNSDDPIPKKERALNVRICSIHAINPETLATKPQTFINCYILNYLDNFLFLSNCLCLFV